MTRNRSWLVQFRDGSVVVRARDQWGAWDSLKARPVDDFGLVCMAEPDENGDPFLVHTETLMKRWGRDEDAALFHEVAVREGLISADKRE